MFPESFVCHRHITIVNLEYDSGDGFKTPRTIVLAGAERRRGVGGGGLFPLGPHGAAGHCKERDDTGTRCDPHDDSELTIRNARL